MTNAQTSTLVLKDRAGTYFLVSQETLEQGRVPEEHKAELEQAIAAAQGGADGDVQGYALSCGDAIKLAAAYGIAGEVMLNVFSNDVMAGVFAGQAIGLMRGAC